jgi:hypothetical protein
VEHTDGAPCLMRIDTGSTARETREMNGGVLVS